MARRTKSPSAVVSFDHLRLDDADRELIKLACPNATRIYLAPLDKGLSGARVWLSQWVAHGVKTKLHVFKVGDYDKLARECKAATEVAAPLEHGFPDMELFPDKRPRATKRGRRGLLRQEFLGTAKGEVVNLRHWINDEAPDANKVRARIDELYGTRMSAWHPENGAFEVRDQTLRTALDRWGEATLGRPARQIGAKELDRSLIEFASTNLEAVRQRCEELRRRREELAVGPVHGDLHAQNVLITDERMELIDFALTAGQKWRALDFLMLECSLKFLVSPAHARLRDLLEIDGVAEPALTGSPCVLGALRPRLLGRSLEKIAAAVVAVRRQALRTHAVRDGEQYRRGLVLMTAGLAGLPEPINRVFLFHSLAWHAVRAE